MKTRRILSVLIIFVLLLGTSFVGQAETAEATVESVSAQLRAIDTLAQMQSKRTSYTASGKYTVLVTDQTMIAKHKAAQSGYQSYVDSMFAARAAAQTAYDSLTPEEQAQVDPTLVAKLDPLQTKYRTDVVCDVTSSDDEYIYEVPKGLLGLVYEVSVHGVCGGGPEPAQIPQLFFVVDTKENSSPWSPDGPYEFDESNYDLTYCVDFETSLVWGSDYRRINLEDAAYFDDAAAKKIRAIMLNSYPYISLEEMKARMKANGMDAEFVDSLTKSDLITGAQTAIWRISNPEAIALTNGGYFSSLSVTQHTGLYFTPYHDFTNEIWRWLPKKYGQTYFDDVEYRVNNLVYYLCSLEGVDATEEQIVISNVDVGRVDLVPLSEDLYSVGLHVLLNGGCDAEDDVALNVVSYSQDDDGNRVQTASTSIAVGKAKEYGVSINAHEGDTIEVTVSGTQNIDKGVYFYEARGGYKTSESLVGAASGETPVQAVSTFEFKRDIDAGLRIYKKSTVDQRPISDITFHVYQVPDSAEVDVTKEPTPVEVADYATEENLVGSVTTDVTGYAALPLERDHTYIVVEEHNKEKVQTPADPFYICVPYPVKSETEGEDGPDVVIEYQDIVSVYPKNTPVVPPPPPPPPPPDKVLGKFKITKYNRNDDTELLSGAEFQVYCAAEEGDADAVLLQVDDKKLLVKPVLADGSPVTLTTDEYGEAISPDLQIGTYYLKETKAPFGYVLPKYGFTVTVESALISEIQHTYIANDRGVRLPATGGRGTALLWSIGGTLVAAALLLIIARKRMSVREAKE